jgi:chromosome segregation ATPase
MANPMTEAAGELTTLSTAFGNLAGILNNSNNSLAELLAPQFGQLRTEMQQGFQQMQAQHEQFQAQHEQFQAQQQQLQAQQQQLLVVVLHLQTQQQNMLSQQNSIRNDVNRLLYMQENARLRMHNANHSHFLPLRKERPGGAHPQGDVPPQGLFPSNEQEFNALISQQLTDLASFYNDDSFETGTVAARKAAFRAFMTGSM